MTDAGSVKPLPCPFCGGETEVVRWPGEDDAHSVACFKAGCHYSTPIFPGGEGAAVAAHNRVAGAVMEAERVRRSMVCVREWANSAIEHYAPFGNDYRYALTLIRAEAEAMLKATSGAAEGGEE